MKIFVDRQRCAGHALCFAKAPDLFPLDDEGFAVADERDVPPDQEALAVLAIRTCPEAAIRVKD